MPEYPTCPECGISLAGRDAYGHANEHWAAVIDHHNPAYTEARHRQALLRSYADGAGGTLPLATPDAPAEGGA